MREQCFRLKHPAGPARSGGTAMGADAARSVTNAFGETHEVESLFLAGTSLFPTIAPAPTGVRGRRVARSTRKWSDAGMLPLIVDC